jgi:hypothetical protein
VLHTCPLSACPRDLLGISRHPLLVADESPSPDAVRRAEARARRRKRVFHTAGLSASAAVLAMSIQSGLLSSDDDQPAATYGDATILDPDDVE